MFWVVQNNIFREQNHSVLIESLRRLDIPHVQVKVVPFYDMLLPSDFDSHSFSGSIDEKQEIKIDESGLVMVLGGTSMTRIARKRGWLPGSFLNDNFHYSKWNDAYGEHLLNYENVVDTFKNINPQWDKFFIRPCEDTKDFSGMVQNKEDFELWRKDCLKIEGSCPFENSQVVASPLKEIYGEYRFFVVDGKVITQSQYKMGTRVISVADVSGEIIEFAQKMIDIWQPARAFVIDIASTPEGLKVIEINNINSAGFYACDVSKIIDAVDNMKF